MIKYNLKEFTNRYGLNKDHPVLKVYKALRGLTNDVTGTWLAGGAVMALITNNYKVSDYDVFFKNVDLFNQFCENIEADGARKIHSSINAVSYEWNGVKIQPINRKYYMNIDAIFNDFDLSISMFALDLVVLNKEILYANEYALYDLARKEIRINNVNALGSTFKRVIKYGKKGFHIPIATYETLMQLFGSNMNIEPTVNALGSVKIRRFAMLRDDPFEIELEGDRVTIGDTILINNRPIVVHDIRIERTPALPINERVNAIVETALAEIMDGQDGNYGRG